MQRSFFFEQVWMSLVFISLFFAALTRDPELPNHGGGGYLIVYFLSEKWITAQPSGPT
jgi:hypothetical protein